MSENESVAVVGCGYVGLVTAVGLAEQGVRVRAYDVDPERVAACQMLRFPMLEPGLVEAARAAGPTLTFHDARNEPWPHAAFTFLAVPTPQGESGHPNLSYLEDALGWVAEAADGPDASTVIVIRSTVPPGTARWAQLEIARRMGGEVRVLANPEFLQEGRALQDFREPSRVVIGGDDRKAVDRLKRLLGFVRTPFVVTDHATAELAKYGSNAFLAVRISFANEMARMAERQGADPLLMLEAVGLDPRLGSRYLKPGIGYGGSCLPKDVAALISMGDAVDEPMELMRATQRVNALQRRRVLRLLADTLGSVSGHRIAVLGLAFKPGTNDVRESPGLRIARELRMAGADVAAWDPSVTAAHLPPDDAEQSVTSSLEEALRGAEAAVLSTDWPDLADIDFAWVRRLMAGDVLVDGRYVWDPERVAAAGLRLFRPGASLNRGAGVLRGLAGGDDGPAASGRVG